MMQWDSELPKEDSFNSKVSKLVVLEGLSFWEYIHSSKEWLESLLPDSNSPRLHIILRSEVFNGQILCKIELSSQTFFSNCWEMVSSNWEWNNEK
jgi:hypothetical protein